MGVAVSEKKKNLEAEHASGPDSGSTTEHRQDVFAFDQLNLEEEEGAQEDGEGVEGKGRTGRRGLASWRGDGGRKRRGKRLGLSKFRDFEHAAFLQGWRRPSNRKRWCEAYAAIAFWVEWRAGLGDAIGAVGAARNRVGTGAAARRCGWMEA